MRVRSQAELVKEANMAVDAGKWALGGLKRLGQGAWNIGFGGRHGPQGWDPFHGVKRLGQVQKVYEPGHALAGQRMFDAAGEAVMEPRRNLLGFMKQELQGARPGRANFMAHDMAAKMPLTPEAAAKAGWKPGQKTWWGSEKKAPTGVHVGEFQQRVTSDPAFAGQLKTLQDVNNLGVMQFIRQHPTLAAKYYGANALQKGFLAGLPAYEIYDTLAHGEGMHPDKGTAGNLGRSLGSGLGWLGAMPLGWVGAPLAVEGVQAITGGAGDLVDRVMGNRPLAERAVGLPSQQQVAALPRHVASQAQGGGPLLPVPPPNA